MGREIPGEHEGGHQEIPQMGCRCEGFKGIGDSSQSTRTRAEASGRNISGFFGLGDEQNAEKLIPVLVSLPIGSPISAPFTDRYGYVSRESE